MKKNGILNPALCAAIAGIGHTDTLVIADPGLPLPDGVPVIDLSLVRNIPAFADVLQAVADEFVIESFILASELREKSADCFADVLRLLPETPFTEIPHQQFKEMTRSAKTIIRTGETTPFANIILVAGVNF